MKRPSFLEGVLVAVAISVAGSVLYAMLDTVLSTAMAWRILITVTALTYVVYLLHRSNNAVGRVTTITGWALVATIAWLVMPLPQYLLTHLGMVWLIRTLYYHGGPLTAAADLGIAALGLLAAVWAMGQTQSLFIALWCLLLIQALFVFIPQRLPRAETPQPPRKDDFDRAYRNAQRALRKLATTR